MSKNMVTALGIAGCILLVGVMVMIGGNSRLRCTYDALVAGAKDARSDVRYSYSGGCIARVDGKWVRIP
jgi:hypothetical protein